jgi:hypothetical protein
MKFHEKSADTCGQTDEHDEQALFMTRANTPENCFRSVVSTQEQNLFTMNMKIKLNVISFIINLQVSWYVTPYTVASLGFLVPGQNDHNAPPNPQQKL